ncbi:MAG TPA: triose-phosphate isomerase [Nitrococcus sp.]|nr:triose-phosphate isomerase [Nitrococcus sp.]
MRRMLIAGNWKMNGSRERTRELVQALIAGLPQNPDYEVIICPSFVYLPVAAEAVMATNANVIGLGAQNVCDQDQGAYTGEIAGDMLAEFGCRWAIVGHSERRQLYGESNALVASRFAAALRHGLTPILCVGERLEEREAGATESILEEQLWTVFEHQGVGAFRSAIIAYEPVWAIGTGRTATPEQAQETHAYIRNLVAERDTGAAAGLRILYGGSVKPDNARALFAQPDVDGGLIGGASLQAEDFLVICRAAGALR